MSVLTASYGLASLRNWKERVERRRSVFEQYLKGLTQTCEFVLESKESKSSRWLTALRFKKEVDPLKIQAALNLKSIETRPLWNPMHLQPAMTGEPGYISGVSEQLFRSGLCVPSGGDLSENYIDMVINELRILLGYN